MTAVLFSEYDTQITEVCAVFGGAAPLEHISLLVQTDVCIRNKTVSSSSYTLYTHRNVRQVQTAVFKYYY